MWKIPFAALATAVLASSASAQPLGIGTNPQGTMVYTLGAAVSKALASAATALHLYGKRNARPGRKMGHLTVLADTPDEALSLARRARDRLVEVLRQSKAAGLCVVLITHDAEELALLADAVAHLHPAAEPGAASHADLVIGDPLAGKGGS